MQTMSRSAAEGGTIDWEAIEASPQFRELVRRKRAFVVPATVFFLAWYLGFILLAGYAPDFMGTSLSGGLTVGYVLALTQFLMVWGLGWLYLRKADREFEPLERLAVAHIESGEAAAPAHSGGRLRPSATPAVEAV